MNKKKIILKSWYRELPNFINEEIIGKNIQIKFFGQDNEIIIRCDSFFKAPVVLSDNIKTEDNFLICGIVDQDGKRHNFINMKSIETENYQLLNHYNTTK